MRILITSGGTKVPLDPARDITNMSGGTFGSQIAHEALRLGHHVTFFCAERSESPFSVRFNFDKDRDWGVAIGRFAKWYNFCEDAKARYKEVKYRTYSDYLMGLREQMAHDAPDVVVLAAAVSDFITDASETKERSDQEMVIKLKPATKIIDLVRGWHSDPDQLIMVGFKLMVKATVPTLTETAWNMIRRCNCDMVVANDLTTLKAGKHEIYIVEPEPSQVGEIPKVSHYTFDLAQAVLQHITSCEATRYGRLQTQTA